MPTATAQPTVTDRTYIRVDKAKVPPGLRFDTPRFYQGSIVTVSFAATKTRRGEHGYGDEWRHSHDASDGESYYSQLVVEVDAGRRLGGYRHFQYYAGTGDFKAWDFASERWVPFTPSARARAVIRCAAGV